MESKGKPGRTPRKLRWVFLILFLVALGFAIAYPGSSADSWVRAYAPNVVTTVIAILTVSFFVEQIIDSARERDRSQRAEVAGVRLRRIAGRHFATLMKMLKAAAKNEAVLSREGDDPRDWLDEGFVSQVKHLDFCAPVGERMDWFDYLSYEVQRFKASIDQIAYSSLGETLDPESLGLLEDFSQDPLLLLIEQSPAIRRVDQRSGMRHAVLLNADQLLRNHADLMRRLIDLCEELTPSRPFGPPVHLQRKDVAPQPGSSRLS